MLIRESPQHKSAIGTFDFSDLNAYLLLAAGLSEPDEELLPLYHQLAQKAHDGVTIPLRDVKGLGNKEPMTTTCNGKCDEGSRDIWRWCTQGGGGG